MGTAAANIDAERCIGLAAGVPGQAMATIAVAGAGCPLWIDAVRRGSFIRCPTCVRRSDPAPLA